MNQAHEYVHLLYSKVLREAPDIIRSHYRQILDMGREFSYVDVEASRQLHTGGRCQSKQCYHNCQMALFLNPELRYYEGWVMSIIPIEHAWLLSGDSEAVIDPTLVDPTVEPNVSKRGYFGVEIPVTFVQRHVIKVMVAESLLWRFISEKVEREYEGR